MNYCEWQDYDMKEPCGKPAGLWYPEMKAWLCADCFDYETKEDERNAVLFGTPNKPFP